LFWTVVSTETANAQQVQSTLITGMVTDASGSGPLPGVNVVIKGTQTGTSTDADGAYSLSVPSGSILVFSFVGFETMEVEAGNLKKINLQMNASTDQLDEVVVIGYGSTTKKEVTGSIATVKSEEFNKGTYNDPIALIQGKVAGLIINNPNGSDPQADYNIILRGTNTLTSGQAPLIIIDGVAGADMKDISPDEVESMDVLKDGAAAAIYGTRGSNGVIIITTKRAKAGTTKVEYTGMFSTQVAPRGVENLSADEFRYAIEQYAPDKAVNIYDDNVDWFKEITRPFPFTMTNNIAISGGTEKFSHRTTIYIDNSNGLLKDNTSNKYLFRTNISQKALGDILLIDYNLGYNMRNYQPANNDLFYQAFIRNPTSSIYDPDNPPSGDTVLDVNYYNQLPCLTKGCRREKRRTHPAM
jgi:TonB-linked SusC/RagA family outer membrane protein